MKKRILSITSCILAFCLLVFSAGCSKKEEKRLSELVYLKITDSKGNEYTIDGCGGSITLEFDQENGTLDPAYCELAFDADLYYYDEADQPDKWWGNTMVLDVQPDSRFDPVNLAVPGEYRVEQWYSLVHHVGSTFGINVKVNEVRPMPDIQFEGGADCIEFVENERYVYKYDGEEHYPAIKLSYKGEEVVYLRYEHERNHVYFDDLMMNEDGEFVEIPEGVIVAKDIGIYQVTMKIYKSRLPEEYKYTFRDIRKDIIIEIIE